MLTSVRRVMLVVVLVGLTVLLAACTAGPNTAASAVPADQQAGFWLGLWQGFIIPVTFIVSLFNPNVGIYEIHNSGAWYDFGFLLGILIPLSGGARAGAPGGRSSRPRRGREAS